MLEPNYHTTKWFSEGLLALEIKKIKVKMNKLVYLGLSILEISKTLMYELWYDYIKPKYRNNAGTVSFIIHFKNSMFAKTLQIMLKKDLIHQIMKLIGRSLHVKIQR